MPEKTVAAPRLHRAARIDDAIHAVRERWARRRGHLPTVIPYTGYGSTTRIRVLGRVLLTKQPKPGSRAARTMQRREERVRGWRSFTSVPVGDVSVTIEVEGIVRTVQADRGGVVDTPVDVELEPGWHTITMQTEGSDAVEAPIYIVAPGTDFGVVCDIDDTVMVTVLPRPFLAFWNTFVLDEHARIPTPGMAVFLERMMTEHPGAPVIYLSTGAWNVAPTLSRFLSRNLYPRGPLLLTDWGPTHDRFFRSGREHKETNLRRLAAEFPDIRWVLIGDDGQHDEEIYGEFALDHPDHVRAIAIRQLSTSEAVLAGGRSKLDQLPAEAATPWVFAPDGAGLSDKLSKLT
ncbi:Phosphatidate phosphatase APP1 [Herbiconiux ginsengi]|uniref:Phosphatidate phosphatase APP1 n=1 Tax=Herbiconiux ginsengi TaxID=381665 RepID=A0A1H3RWS0_9MICO|nr:phosphatase domain-containing protein [Herbiconiux ginsengi]SDZ30112.1 Phosphatidate phosphatase APP1 [Herbiconiux ginsengi]